MKQIIIVTEANNEVATGHLIECIDCAKELLKKECQVSFWVNDNMEENLKKRIPCDYKEYHESIELDSKEFFLYVNECSRALVLFNLRKISVEFLQEMRAQTKDVSIVCIDEFGHRPLPADVIINPMIDSSYWNYEGSNAKVYCGAEYLILSEKLSDLHNREKEIREEIKSITITMGGVDPKNYTLNLVDWISNIFSEVIEINLVIGAGNRKKEEIYQKVKKYENFNIYENVSNLLDIMVESDLVFCAGGNTLHEVACLGTPAVILPSAMHEVNNGTWFMKNGFGFMVNLENELYGEILQGVKLLENQSIRRNMSIMGKKISDGLGRCRVASILRNI